MRIILFVFCLLLIIYPFDGYSLSKTDKIFANVLLSYKKGEYLDAVKKLKRIETIKKYVYLAHYWKGLCFGKLQQYDKAIEEYKFVLKDNLAPKEIYYELGQAYYAIFKFDKAIAAFKQSILKRFQVAESFYYLGFIELTREKFTNSTRYTKKLIDQDDANDELLQAGHFQLGEAFLGNIEKYNKKITKDIRKKVIYYVIPQYKKAMKIDNQTALAKTINKKLQVVRKKYGIKRRTFYNGKPYPRKRFNLYLSEKLSYDSNVILESSDADLDAKASNTSSFIFQTSGHISTKIIHRRRFQIKPEFSFTHLYHTRNDVVDIYKNDSLSLSPALKNSLEHRMFGDPASLMMDINFDYTSRKRDVPLEKSLKKYGDTLMISIGEELRLFSSGKTIIKYYYKKFNAHDILLNTKTNNISFDHRIFTAKNYMFYFNNSASFISAKNKTNSSNEYSFAITWKISEAFWQYAFTSSFRITATDTKLQKATRGTEMKYNPYLSISRTFWRKMDLTFSYSFTNKTSNQKEIYAYSQHVLAVDVRWNFF